MNRKNGGYIPPSNLLNRNFIALMIIVFSVTTAFNMTLPVMSGFAASLGATGTLMGLAASGFAFVALLTRPITSPMADLFNKKKQYQFAIILLTVCNMGFVIAGNIGLLIAFRCAQGFALGVLGTVGATMSSFYVPEDRITTGMGIFMIVQVGSLALGPYVSLWLVQTAGYGACFTVTAAVSALSFLLTMFVSDVDEGREKHRISELFIKPKLSKFVCFECLVPAAVMCMFALPFACINSFLAQAAAANGVANVGAFFTVYAVTTILIRPLIEILGNKFGQSSLIIPCSLIFIVGLALCANATSLVMYLIIAVLMGVGMGSVSVIMLIICTGRVGASRRGLASGTYYLSMDTGFAIGPVIGGTIAAALDYNVLMYALIGPIAVAIVISVFGKKGMRPLVEADAGQGIESVG